MKKRAIIIPVAITASLLLALAVPFAILGIRTSLLNSNYSYLINNGTYSSETKVTGINLVTQHVSCGYATIEMMSDFYGKKVTEDDLDKKNNGAVSTSSSDGFLKEINASIEKKEFVKESYLKHDDLLKEIHNSLTKNNPVAIEWAAKDEKEEWTLHFSLVSGVDYGNDNVTVYNPYGYIENITINDFLDRTSFKAFENMPIFYEFGFAFGAFEKNTIFYAK